jgi:hypothetical protein
MPPTPAAILPRFLPRTGNMVRATSAQAKEFQTYLAEMDFAQELSSGVTPYAYDPIPETWKGGRKVEGWRFVFEVDTDKRE